MDKVIFPKEIIEYTSESHFSRNSTRSNIIYITILTGIIATLALLPIIRVDVGVRSQGVIRPVSEIKPLVSLMPGRLDSMGVGINDVVKQGSLIARIASPVIDEKLEYNQARRRNIELLIADLSGLLRLDSASVKLPPFLHTPLYRNSWMEVRQRLQQAYQRVAIAAGELERNEILFRRGLLSRSVYDELHYGWMSAVSDFHLILDHQKNLWQTDLHGHREEFDRLMAEKKQLEKEKEYYLIRSPVSGTIQNLAGIATGSHIYPNQVIAEITPDTSLVVEIYVAPNDIGLIRDQMKVRLQVSAFNYNQWGVLNGIVAGISRDAVMSGTVPYFRVRCIPEQTYLTLNNGFRGNLKKGMTVQARFIVNRRSLLQLLYDKVDDWINPAWGYDEYENLTAFEMR